MGCSSSANVDLNSVDSLAPVTPVTSSHLKYNLGEKIGRGSYAQVHIATTTQKTSVNPNGQVVAVKVRNLAESPVDQLDKVLKSSFNEVAVWTALGKHPNCVRLLDSFFDDHLAYMVMEKCDGSLFNYLQRGPVVNERCMAKAFEHMLMGISHMHSVNVLHRDLKPDNFLVQGRTVKICDFGLSAMLPASGVMKGVIGTPPYMPPEMLNTSTYDQKADVWSFGVVAYLLLTGEFPYQTSDGTARMMKQSIAHGGPAACDKLWLSGKAIGFLNQVLKRTPEERPTAKSALTLTYVTNPDTEHLPCLKHILKAAYTTGAFDSCPKVGQTQTDVILGRLKRGELGKLSSKSFSNEAYNATVSTTSKKCEDLHECPSPSMTSKSTGYGSSPHSSEPSKLSFELSPPTMDVLERQAGYTKHML